MQLKIIKNPDEKQRIIYKVARIVYAETNAVSLRAVEALTSMIQNFSMASGRDIEDIVSDENLFEALNSESPKNKLLSVTPNDKKFQMCLRIAGHMIHGVLPDCCCGATRFHHDNVIPSWAMSLGYIADIDGLLFYL